MGRGGGGVGEDGALPIMNPQESTPPFQILDKYISQANSTLVIGGLY